MNTEIEPLVKKQIGKEVNRIAQEQVKDILNNGKFTKVKSDRFNFDDDDDDNDSFTDDSGDVEDVEHNSLSSINDEETKRILSEIEESESFDLFSEYGDYWMSLGQIVRYDINKGGKLLTKKDHPYSWEELQKEFGGGNYKVMARLPANKNKYLKSQNKQLLNSPETSPDYLLKNLIEKNKSIEDKNNTQPVGFNMMEVLETVRRTNEAAIEQANNMRRESLELAQRAKLEAKEDARSTLELYEKMLEKSQPKQGSDLLTQLAPLLTAILPKLLDRPAPLPIVDNTKAQFDMMMKIQQMNMDMMEKQNESNREMFKSMTEQIKEIGRDRKSSGGGGEMSSFEMFKMMNDAKSEGFEQMRMVHELAKEQAIEREELRGERNDTPTEKESTIDTLIKGFIPVIAGKMASPQVMPASRPVPRVTPQVMPQQRGAVSPSNTIRANENRTNGATVQAEKARTTSGNGQKSETGIRSSERNVLNIPAIEAPKTNDFLNAGDDVSFDASTIPTYHEEKNTHEKITAVDTNEKDQANAEMILSIVAPVAITGYTTEGVTLDIIADKSITDLEANGIDLSTVERDFDDETLSGIISALPEDLQLLTKDLRNVIIAKISQRIR